MIKVNADRQLTINDEVEVYRNLNKGNFSIRNKKSKLVVAIGTDFLLSNVKIKVSEAGRKRVNEEKRKNVHGFICGEYKGITGLDTSNLDELYYNPYTLDSFINKRTGEKVYELNSVYFKDNKAWIVR